MWFIKRKKMNVPDFALREVVVKCFFLVFTGLFFKNDLMHWNCISCRHCFTTSKVNIIVSSTLSISDLINVLSIGFSKSICHLSKKKIFLGSLRSARQASKLNILLKTGELASNWNFASVLADWNPMCRVILEKNLGQRMISSSVCWSTHWTSTLLSLTKT